MFRYIVQIIQMFDALIFVIVLFLFLFLGYVISFFYYSTFIPNESLHSAIVQENYQLNSTSQHNTFAEEIVTFRKYINSNNFKDAIAMIDVWLSRISSSSSLSSSLLIEKCFLLSKIAPTLEEYKIMLDSLGIAKGDLLNDMILLYEYNKNPTTSLSRSDLTNNETLMFDLIRYMLERTQT